ncbi:hypothetical protein N0V94_009514, partial [Neodidymelliopsis sp. IMI 364377]
HGKTVADDLWGFAFNDAWVRGKKKEGAVEEEPTLLCKPPTEFELVPEPVCVKEEDPWACVVVTTMAEHTTRESVPREDAEPEAQAILHEPEPEPELAVNPFAGLTKKQKKKLQRKIETEATAREEELAQLAKEQALLERLRLEEEEAAAASVPVSP